jgi:arginyl-tRNA synthetase
VLDLEKSGLMSKCPDGTPRKLLWTRDPEDEASVPLTIAKSDGGFGYDTSDLATIRSVMHANTSEPARVNSHYRTSTSD